MLLFNTNKYRVKLLNNLIEVNEFGLGAGAGIDGHSLPAFFSYEDLPLWMERKLAILQTFSYEPPTEDVRGVGKRIAKNIFWVDYDGDKDGDDTGKES